MTDGEELYRKDPVTGEFVQVGPTEGPHSANSGGRAGDAPPPQQRLPFPAVATAAQRASPSTAEPKRPNGRIIKRVLLGVAALVVGLIALGVIVAVAIGDKSKSQPSAAMASTRKKTAVPKPLACSHFALAAMPKRCLTPSIRRQIAATKRAQAAAAARAKAKAHAQALAAADAYARANAWHTGYNQQDENVYWKWVSGRSCQDFAQYGCWHVEVITASGCQSYVAVNANEYSGGSIINSLLDNQGYGIPPETPRIFELDADQPGVTANDVSIECV
jgi:hypothetical protein